MPDGRLRRMSVIRSSVWSLKQGFHVAPGLMLAALAATAIGGVVPSLQVYLVSHLTDAVGAGESHTALVWAVITGVCVAGYLGLDQIANTLCRMTQVVMRARNMSRIDDVLAALDPIEVTSSVVQAEARTAREAVLQGTVQMQATSAISTIKALITAVSLCVAIGSTSPLAAIAVLGALIPLSAASMWYSTRDAMAWPAISEARRFATYREELITYQTTSQELASLDARSVLSDSAQEHLSEARDQEMWLERQGLVSDGLASLVSSLFVIGALIALIASDAGTGQTAGGIVGVLSGIMATTGVGFVIGSLRTGANAIAYFRAFADRPKTASAPSDAPEPVEALTVTGLAVTYTGRVNPSLSKASLCAKRGEMIAIVGPNGAGKSTLVRGILGLAPITAGSIQFDQEDVTSAGFPYRHQAVGLLTQEYGRYELTVRENLSLGTRGRKTSDDQLWSALHQARADAFVRALPEGLDTQLGEQWDGTGLSGGQWQRLALARLALRGAAIWILDEPTSAIDAEAEADIFARLRDISSEHITIVVSHRAWTLREMDRIYVVDKGAIVETGDYATLMDRGGRFADLFASQDRGPDTAPAYPYTSS